MILEPKHKNLKDRYKIKERVLKIFNIRRHMSMPLAFEWHYFQAILNWWHSLFKIFIVNITILSMAAKLSMTNDKARQLWKLPDQDDAFVSTMTQLR